jgi:hypothetical protein
MLFICKYVYVLYLSAVKFLELSFECLLICHAHNLLFVLLNVFNVFQNNWLHGYEDYCLLGCETVLFCRSSTYVADLEIPVALPVSQTTLPHFSQDGKLHSTFVITSNIVRLIKHSCACVEIRGSLSYHFRKITPLDHSLDPDYLAYFD